MMFRKWSVMSVPLPIHSESRILHHIGCREAPLHLTFDSPHLPADLAGTEEGGPEHADFLPLAKPRHNQGLR